MRYFAGSGKGKAGRRGKDPSERGMMAGNESHHHPRTRTRVAHRHIRRLRSSTSR